MSKVNGDIINVTIFLDQVDKNKITKTQDGKKILKLSISKRLSIAQGINPPTLSVYHSQSNEEREQKKPKVYVGGGWEFKFNK